MINIAEIDFNMLNSEWLTFINYLEVNDTLSSIELPTIVKKTQDRIFGKGEPNSKVKIIYEYENNNLVGKTLQTDTCGKFTYNLSDLEVKEQSTFTVIGQDQEYLQKQQDYFVEKFVDILKNYPSEGITSYFKKFLKGKKTKLQEYIIETCDKVILILSRTSQVIQQDKAVSNKTILNHPTFKQLLDQVSKNNTSTSIDSDLKEKYLVFTSKYIVYKVYQENYLQFSTSPKTKKQFLDELRDKDYIGEKSDTTYLGYAGEVVPTLMKKDSMRQSANLTPYQQTAIGITLYLRHTNDTYFRFIRAFYKDQIVKNIPVEKIIDSQRKIKKYIKDNPINSQSDILFAETSIQDTYHFSVFHALYNLQKDIGEDLNDLLMDLTNIDSIMAIFMINEIRLELKKHISEAKKLTFDIKSFIDAYSVNDKPSKIVDKILNDQTLLDEINNDLYNYLADYDISKINISDIIDENLLQSIIKNYYDLSLSNSDILKS